jgi:putative hemolysin
MLPNPDVAKANGWRYGLPLEGALDFDLSSIAPASAIGEVGRLCVDRAWRNKGAIPELCIAMCLDSLLHGVEYWVSSANMSSDSGAEAQLLATVLERRQMTRHDIVATSKVRRQPVTPWRFRFFTEEERRRAIEGESIESLRLPPVISVDARLGARYFGPPVWDGHFGMYAMPLIASVREVLRNAGTLRRVSRRDRKPAVLP